MWAAARACLLACGVAAASGGCPAGAPAAVSVRRIYGTVRSAEAVEDNSSSVVPCSSVAENLEGNISLDCIDGELEASTAGCGLVCTANQTGHALIGNRRLKVAIPNIMSDGDNYSQSCVSVGSGYSGEIGVRCDSGVVVVDTAACVPGSCPRQYVVLRIGDTGRFIDMGEDLNHGAVVSLNCTEAHSEYVGNATASCKAGTVYVDPKGCLCNAPSCLGRSCGPIVRAPVSANGYLGEAVLNASYVLRHRQVVSLRCSDALYGHEGEINGTCDSGVFGANASACVARLCPGGSAAAMLVSQGGAGMVALDANLSHGDAAPLRCVDANEHTSGAELATCYLGDLFVPGGGLACADVTATSSTTTTVSTTTTTTMTLPPVAGLRSQELDSNKAAILGASIAGSVSFVAMCCAGFWCCGMRRSAAVAPAEGEGEENKDGAPDQEASVASFGTRSWASSNAASSASSFSEEAPETLRAAADEQEQIYWATP